MNVDTKRNYLSAPSKLKLLSELRPGTQKTKQIHCIQASDFQRDVYKGTYKMEQEGWWHSSFLKNEFCQLI